MTYTFQQGESIAMALDVVSGDPGIVGAVSAAMKPVAAGRSSADPTTAVAAAFDVSFIAANANDPARWLLSLSPSVSAELLPGSYVADARLTVGGGVLITETVAIRIRPSVTP